MGREHRARRPTHEPTRRWVCVARPESNRNVDRQDSHVVNFGKVRRKIEQLVAGESAIFKDDHDPAALRPIDAGDSQRGLIGRVHPEGLPARALEGRREIASAERRVVMIWADERLMWRETVRSAARPSIAAIPDPTNAEARSP